jgi:hypothetical protein
VVHPEVLARHQAENRFTQLGWMSIHRVSPSVAVHDCPHPLLPVRRQEPAQLALADANQHRRLSQTKDPGFHPLQHRCPSFFLWSHCQSVSHRRT